MATKIRPTSSWTQDPILTPQPPRDPRRRARARDVLVTMLVCLGLWTLLFSPILERNAETGPVGARRSVALAVLRPVTAASRAIGLTAVVDPALQALGDDPNAQAGGELDLPDLHLPPLGSTGRTGTTGDDHPPQGGGTQGSKHEQGDHGDGGAGVEPVVAPIRTPSPQSKLRVVIVGDSLSQGLGPAVEGWFDPDVSRVFPLGRQSTGLARQDYFNWSKAMREIEDKIRPDLVFVMLGTNDNQAQISRDGTDVAVGSTAWVEAYRDHVEAFLHEATSAGSHVVWVGVPVVRDHRRWDFYRRVNAIYEAAAEANPLATFVDTWDAFRARDGGYAAYLRNERGVVQEMRAPDGVHFTPTGYGYVARLAIRAAADAFDLSQRAVSFHL
jgi:uncharacterized protein